MNLTQITSKDWSTITKLLAKKEACLVEIAKIDRALAMFSEKRKAPLPVGPKKKRKGAARGKLKDTILKELKAAGKAGITVKELAVRTGASTGSLFSWFYSTGKKNKSIKKVGEAKYCLV